MNAIRIVVSLWCAGAAVALTGTAPAQNWPEFRGPHQNGVSDVQRVPLRWSETEQVTWKTELPGRGWSSPVVWEDSIWLTTAVEVTPTEAERAQLLAGEEPRVAKSRQVAVRIELQVLEVDLKSGTLRRAIPLAGIVGPDAIHALNSYASPTPVIESGRLYAEFGTFGVFAIDTVRGEVLWEKHLPLEHSVGPGSSPVLVGDLLILVRDGVDQQYVTALDKTTGATVWKTDRPPMDAPTGDQKKAYCTPILVEGDAASGRPAQLVIPTSQWIVSYAPDTGEEIWRVHHGKGFSLVPRPVAGHGHVYACTGFGKPQLWAVRLDGQGDVTGTHVTWKETRRISKKPSPLLIEDALYILEDDGGVLSCLDPRTGEVRWADRLGGNYSASPVYAAGHLFLASQEGVIHVLRHDGPTGGAALVPVAENAIDGEIMATPVPLEGGFLIRSKTALYRIGT